MFKKLKRNIIKMFREILIYHNKSLEFRAKILTLIVAIDDQINACKDKKLREVAAKVYADDNTRADLLVDTVHEYCLKIQTNNGLDLEHLILLVEREAKENKRYTKKINIERLKEFEECLTNEDDKIFHQRVIEYLRVMKEEYGE